MLSESVHSGTRSRTLSVTWCHPRKMETLDQHRQTPAEQGSWMRFQHSPPPNPKLKSLFSPPLFSPPLINLVFEPQHLKTLSLGSQIVTAFLSPHLLLKVYPLHLKVDLNLSTQHAAGASSALSPSCQTAQATLTQDMANLSFFPRTQKGSDPERRIIEPNPPDLLQSDDSYTV